MKYILAFILGLFLPLVSAQAAPVTNWAINHAQSKLTFEGTQELAPFTGTIPHFDGAIAFDPDNLPASHVAITVDIKDISTGSDDRDQYLPQKDWLDAKDFPQATYTASSFEKKDTGYIAHGKLTLRGVSLPVDLPFTVTFSPDHKTAKVQGTASFSRLDFKIGAGEWADPKSVGAQIKVNVALVATAR